MLSLGFLCEPHVPSKMKLRFPVKMSVCELWLDTGSVHWQRTVPVPMVLPPPPPPQAPSPAPLPPCASLLSSMEKSFQGVRLNMAYGRGWTWEGWTFRSESRGCPVVGEGLGYLVKNTLHMMERGEGGGDHKTEVRVNIGSEWGCE